MVYFKLLFLVLAISSCKAQPVKVQTDTNNNTLLWEISGKGISTPSYLFGTYHLLCKSDINLSPQLKQALKNSNELYLELDLDDPSTLMSGMILMRMKDGKNLKDLYSAANYKKLVGYFNDSLNMPIQLLSSMKPLFLVAMLYPKMMPCKTFSGVEEELMKLVKDDKKEIRGLETMAFQSSIFDSIPYEEQAAELLKTIDSFELYKKYFDTSVQVYKSQDLKMIADLFNKPEFGLEDHMEVLLYNRNRNWVNQLKTILKGKPVFVAVGAGHLVGEQGLIELLKKEGYTLKPVYNK